MLPCYSIETVAILRFDFVFPIIQPILNYSHKYVINNSYTIPEVYMQNQVGE